MGIPEFAQESPEKGCWGWGGTFAHLSLGGCILFWIFAFFGSISFLLTALGTIDIVFGTSMVKVSYTKDGQPVKTTISETPLAIWVMVLLWILFAGSALWILKYPCGCLQKRDSGSKADESSIV